jgi:hypothetical protein
VHSHQVLWESYLAHNIAHLLIYFRNLEHQSPKWFSFQLLRTIKWYHVQTWTSSISFFLLSLPWVNPSSLSHQSFSLYCLVLSSLPFFFPPLIFFIVFIYYLFLIFDSFYHLFLSWSFSPLLTFFSLLYLPFSIFCTFFSKFFFYFFRPFGLSHSSLLYSFHHPLYLFSLIAISLLHLK